MKTPFDTVLRMRRREIDQTRIAIHAETTRLLEIDHKNHEIREELAYEYQACAESWSASSEAFLRRRLSQQTQLLAQRIAVSEEITRLRRRAVDAYGSQHVVENAADAFRADHKRRQSWAEQRDADDFCAARIAASPRLTREPDVPRLPSR